MFLSILKVFDALRYRRHHNTGQRGEDLAQRFLQRAGYIVVARNYRMESGAGELDLIAWQGETLVFVEVKTRLTDDFGAPDRAVGPVKERHLLRAARDYVHHAGTPWDQVRFDVIGVLLRSPPAITHFRDVLPQSRPVPAL